MRDARGQAGGADIMERPEAGSPIESGWPAEWSDGGPGTLAPVAVWEGEPPPGVTSVFGRGLADSTRLEATSVVVDGLITPDDLLEARFPTRDRRTGSRLLIQHLRRLGVAEARVDFAVGGGIAEIRTRFDLRDLGFSHLAGYAEGPCGFSAAHARELARLARCLPELPALRAAFLAGLVPRTRLREVVGVATPETDAAWAQLARRLGTRELARLAAEVKRQQAAAVAGGGVRAPDPGPPRSGLQRVAWLGSRSDRVTWRFALALVRQVAGVAGPEHALVEILAAETLSSTGHDPAGREEAAARASGELDRGVTRAAGDPKVRAPNPRKLERLAARLRKRLATGGVADAPDVGLPGVELPDWSSFGSARAIQVRLLQLLARRRSIDFERSRLLSWMQGRLLHHELGFARFPEAVERLLGIAPREAMRLVALQRELSLLPTLELAWRQGRLSTDQLEQLARVVTPTTEHRWERYAALVTPKMLSAAIEAALVGGRQHALPPWGVPLRELLLDWQEHFGVALRRGGAACGREGCDHAGSACAGAYSERAAILGGAGLTPLSHRLCRIGFEAPEEVALLWADALAAVRQQAAAPLSDADSVRRLARHFLDTHVTEEVLKRARQHAAIERDGWCCAMPHCRSRGPFHEHHREYRSAGGPDETWNLVTLCVSCHAMVHAGRVIVRGRAPDDLTFLLGVGGDGAREQARAGPASGTWRGEVRAEVYAEWLTGGRSGGPGLGGSDDV